MSRNLFPRRDPAEIAAELVDSCQWDVPGAPAEAAHKAAYYLFSEMVERLGPDRARAVFRHHARPTLSLTDRANHGLLDRLDIMGHFDRDTGEWCAKPNMRQLAIRVAEENKSLPREQWRGAGGTDAATLARHIKTLVDDRERQLQAGTWHGPVNHDQVVRYFKPKNIATFSEEK